MIRLRSALPLRSALASVLVLAATAHQGRAQVPGLSESDRANILKKVQQLQKQIGSPESPASAAIPEPAMNEADRARILEKVQMLQKEFERQRKEITASALSRFESAASSEGAAVEFFLSCQKVIQDRTPDLDPTNDKEDAKAAQERMKQQIAAYEAARGKAAALQVVLQHLVLTIQAPTMKDRGALVTRMRDMVAKAMNVAKMYAAPNVDPIKRSTPPKGNGKAKQPRQVTPSSKEEDRARRQIIQTMEQGGLASVFAQAYNLRNYFKPLEGWSDSPLNLDSVYNGFIMDWYREHNPVELSNVWDEYLGHELALHRCSQDDNSFARWGITGYKDLQWKKWMDLLKYGTRRPVALDELVKLVKENLTYPGVEQWVADLTSIAQSITPPPPPPVVAEPPPEASVTDAEKAAK